METAGVPFGALAPPTDDDYMRAALAIGRRERGQTAENPAVGALIVRDGVVEAIGWTQAGGRPHAEAAALAAAGDRARGATLYVTLEPCSHHGKTPPCAEAIVRAGVARVVSAMEDPDPRVAGRGHALLRAAGVALTVGVQGEAARRAHLGHILRASEGRPAITLKLAETRDGFAAGDEHDPRLSITSAAANTLTHMLRATHDAIMIGVGTALADDPLMTVRAPGLDHRKPLRVIVDARLDLSPRGRLAASARETPALVLTRADADPRKADALRALGVEITVVADADGGRVSLLAAAQALAQRGVAHVFSEGGPRMAQALLAQGLADEVVVFTAPRPLGRPGAPAFVGDARALLEDGRRYRLVDDSFSGPDRLRRYEKAS